MLRRVSVAELIEKSYIYVSSVFARWTSKLAKYGSVKYPKSVDLH